MSQDDFADVRDMVNGLGAGILAGEGVEHHNKVKAKICQDGSGFEYQLRCDHCGRTLVVSVPWTELIIMGQSVLPGNNEWKHDGRNGCFVPQQGCSNCGDTMARHHPRRMQPEPGCRHRSPEDQPGRHRGLHPAESGPPALSEPTFWWIARGAVAWDS